jgi:hypothetical protein
MGKLEALLQNYERYVALPWPQNLAGPQKVWFAVYDETDERRLRARLGEFELATKRRDHRWSLCDLTNTFAEWMAQEQYRESFFESPEDVEITLGEFHNKVTQKLRVVLDDSQVNDQTVVSVHGIASLYGFMRVSQLVASVEQYIKGRLLVFFPGKHENNTYRLLDARDGWNYLAVPITAHEGARES